jgi:hypothetical protein
LQCIIHFLFFSILSVLSFFLIFRSICQFSLSDNGNSTIRRVNRHDGTVTTLASPKGGYLDGPVAEARFMSPFGICSDSHGTHWMQFIFFSILKIRLNESN